MLEFNIQVAGGSLVEINEPIGFDKVDFNLTRSETLHSISSNFAGNSIEFEFNKDVHYNVFNAIVQEYNVNGFLGDVMLFISYNGNELFKGSFDFSTTQTDMLNYLKCQIVNKDKLYLLDKNKNIAVDLLSDEDLDKNTVTPAPITRLFLPPVELFKESVWEDTQNAVYFMTTANTTSVFNNIKSTTKYEINDSLSWLDTSQLYTLSLGRDIQLVSAKENLKDINISIEFGSNTSIVNASSSNDARVRLIVRYGLEMPDQPDSVWENNTNVATLLDFTLTPSNDTYVLPSELNYTIDDLTRGSGIWIYWLVEGPSLTTAVVFYNTSSKITINATSTKYYSLTNSIKYTELVENAVKKAANIQNTQWNVHYYNNTYAFNGNLLRQITDKGFEVKWQDIAKQLNERNLGAYYNETTDTLVIDHRNNILGSNLIGSYGDLAKKDFYFVTEDENFVVNKFSYKYSKYQAQKENNVIGNNASVHGESEWYIANKTFEGSIDVDLPFVRDSFMIEDIRQKALEYKEDTATNEDNTVVLMEVVLNDDGTGSKIWIEENINIVASYDDDNVIQTFMNDGSFNWKLIGIESGGIYINDNYYTIEESTPNILKVTPSGSSPIFNGAFNLKFRYRLYTDYIGRVENGLFNQSFSIRQNIQYWLQTLNVANYYNKMPITNTVYKENKDASINGLVESSDIVPINAIHTPRIIDSKVMISVDDYFYLKNNKIGYISIYNQNNELINIYLTELKALFLNGCNQMEATLKGWLRNDVNTYYTITKNNINGIQYENLVFYFDDINESVTISENGDILLYSNVEPPYICSPTLCFPIYLDAKNYLLSL